MKIWDSLSGIIAAEMTSGAPEREMALFLQNHISLMRVERRDDLTVAFWVTRSDYRKAASVCRKSGAVLKIKQRGGLFWKAKNLLHRKTLLTGVVILTLIILLLPTCVLSVKVEGNQLVPTRRILEAAEESGIHFGASRRAVRSEKMKNALLSAIPELRWAGINTYGCTAVISVKEKEAEIEKEDNSDCVCSISANRDGVITSITATRGTAQVVPGQAVSKGQVLISGYTDCGLAIRAEQAEGEVYAVTDRLLTVFTPSNYTRRVKETSIRHRTSILLGKKRINLWFGSGIWDGVCGKMYREHWLTLPGGFRLPFALAVEEYRFSDSVPENLPGEDTEMFLHAWAQDYLHRLLRAGSVKSTEETVSETDRGFFLEGHYSCEEMIGVVLWEQNGEYNGKSN